ncbi:hypothetical protein E2C01_092492 [Portunus trituberculatus]|uniref:Uncharacterized protein n=1 Tax=Portunus trituberculatus TaxID=210409 RepID=A0A5B7JGL0_PORTR|nr:hypothetical protein [Portunus trituberculatus]
MRRRYLAVLNSKVHGKVQQFFPSFSSFYTDGDGKRAANRHMQSRPERVAEPACTCHDFAVPGPAPHLRHAGREGGGERGMGSAGREGLGGDSPACSAQTN